MSLRAESPVWDGTGDQTALPQHEMGLWCHRDTTRWKGQGECWDISVGRGSSHGDREEGSHFWVIWEQFSQPGLQRSFDTSMTLPQALRVFPRFPHSSYSSCSPADLPWACYDVHSEQGWIHNGFVLWFCTIHGKCSAQPSKIFL